METRFASLVKAPYLWLRRTSTDAFFERRYGVQTSGVIQLDELGIAEQERNRYKAAGWLSLPRVLPRREVCAHDVFIDFGSGMGRVVLQASTYPFKRVIGVELSEQLHEIARENLARNQHRQRCAEVSLEKADVLEYEIPDDVTVAFLNNPFSGSIFSTVVERLIRSVDRAPRTLRIIYANPVEERALLETGRVSCVRRLRGMRPTAEWSRSNATRLYEIRPQRAVAKPPAAE